MTTSSINLAQFLNQQYLCESLTVREVQTLLNYTELVTYQQGEVIAEIGDVGEALYFVVSGEAALLAERENREVEVGRMVEGELMGEMSFFDRKPRMARMVTISKQAELLKLSHRRYQRLRIEQPYIAVNLLEHAIISLDHLVRRVTMDGASFNDYMAQEASMESGPEEEKELSA
ncbi:MAG: cyclic nucleotide-binding domain-containing protein [Gammaproteobacteria bacterium]|nr:cyclic nucleotide-binding domain-containing protein [Gammaproteobacteria bacterium]